MDNPEKVTIVAQNMTMFPAATSLQASVDHAVSQLPITDKNTLFGILMSYHNTLLAETAKGA